MPTPKLQDASPPGATERAFRVESAGRFAGQALPVGAIVRVAPGPIPEGAAVVLAPRCPGRPRLGHVRRGRLFGAAGEPCLDAVWEVVGVVARIEEPLAPRPVPWAARQLSLLPVGRPVAA